MRLFFPSSAIGKATRRLSSRRCAFAHTRAFSLVMFALFAFTGNAFCTPTQSQETAKPTATPETKRRPKLGVGESAQPASTTGTIEGRVVSDDGRPVTNASVMAQAGGFRVIPRMSRVDTEGRFVFDDLPAAAYVIIATAPGYIDQSLSESDPNQWPRHLIGTQLKITMIKGGVITGTVTNSKGDPVVGVPVNATPANDLAASNLNTLGLGTADETDDRGIYRIYGLLPGQYTVTAGGGGPYGQFGTSGFDLDIPTFYPSTTRDAAALVSVHSGEETSGIDIKYQGLGGHSISGFVTGEVETGAVFGRMTIMLAHAGTTSVLSFAIANTMDQRRVFSFNAIADGEYDLLVSYQSRLNEKPLIGTKRVTVRGGDVTGIELKLGALASIVGTISLEPIKPEDKCDKRASELIETVIMTPRDEPKKSGSQIMTQLFTGAGGTLNAKGEFTAPNLEASKYRLGITLPTDAWYIRSINSPAATPPKGPQPAAATPRTGDAWQGVITLKSGEQFGPVKIVVGQDAAGMGGRITVPPETAIPVGLRVHLVPEERDRVDNILRYSETLVSRDGSFSFTNLAPGRYFVVTRIEPFAETQSTPPRPIAWDPTARIKLRREAEAANNLVELKPCQRLVDYTLALKTGP